MPRLFTRLAAALLLGVSANAQVEGYFRIQEESSGAWRIEARFVGLPEEGAPLVLTTPGWAWPEGQFEWLVVEGGKADQERSRLDLSGSASERRLEYRVHLAPEPMDAGVRPTHRASYNLGLSNHVLVWPCRQGTPLAGALRIELIASDEERTIVTGWAGASRGSQVTRVRHVEEHGPIVFGSPRFRSSVAGETFRVEALQFGSGPEASASAAEVVGHLGPVIAQQLGHAVPSPLRVILSDATESGLATPAGLVLAVPPWAEPDFSTRREFRTTAAHELFHLWLGLGTHESHGSLAWFREGFTEYAALWLCASEGLVPEEDFASMLEEYDRFARRSTAFGQVPFTAAVDWRDGSGPYELMAYRGGPVLALALDVELRQQGQSGVLQLVRDLLALDDPVFDPDELPAWFEHHGLSAAWRDWVAGLGVPTALETLVRAGFSSHEVPKEVAYLGLETQEEGSAWRIRSIDPEGPCADLDLRRGDLITSFYPYVGTPIPLGPLDTRYRFGLELLTPGLPGAFLEVERDGEPLQVEVEPRLVPWGRRTEWQTTKTSKTFFRFQPL